VACVKIYYFSQDKQIIAQSVDILNNIAAHCNILSEAVDASFSPSADCSADMALGGGHCSSWKDKPLGIRQQYIHLVNTVFQQLGLSFGQTGRIIEWCLALVSCQMSSYVEEIALDAEQKRSLLVVVGQQRQQQTEVRAKLVDGAIGFQPDVALADAHAAHEVGHALVAAPGVNGCYLHSICSLGEG